MQRALLEDLARALSVPRMPSSSTRRDREKEAYLEPITAQDQRAFRYETLAAATRGFSEKNRLGQGGFGPVYRGRLEDGRDVAVKRLGARSRQGALEFRNEAMVLSQVQHRNVVNLIGYCARGAEDKLLVYEYVPNESIDKILFTPASGHSSSNSLRLRRAELTWPRRHEVMVGVARGLLYLHEEAHTPIIHRDIKASNILLDDRWVPKIADFGMARLFPDAGDGRSRVHTPIAGTIEYMAPEYLMHGDLSTKADVFSFGVVVLEMISGRKNSAFVPPADSEGADSLLEYAWMLDKKGRSLELLDPAVRASAVAEQVELCVRIGLLCVQADPRRRPDMRCVLIILTHNHNTSGLEVPTRPGRPGLFGSHYSVGSLFGTSSPTTTATSHAWASLSNTTMTSSTYTMRSQGGLPSHREEEEYE